METPRQATGAEGSVGYAGANVAYSYLRARSARPLTKRERQVQEYRRLAKTYSELADATEAAGLGDSARPEPRTRKPSYVQRLRLGLESGRFRPPNAAAMLADLDRAYKGDRKAKERIISYLETPGILEALDDA